MGGGHAFIEMPPGSGPINIAVLVAVYIYFALTLQTIAKKANIDYAWIAWIPVANIFLMMLVSDRPLWWPILLLIPIVNFAWVVMWILVWMDISAARKKPSWLGVLMIIPFVNLGVLGVLAWKD